MLLWLKKIKETADTLQLDVIDDDFENKLKKMRNQNDHLNNLLSDLISELEYFRVYQNTDIP